MKTEILEIAIVCSFCLTASEVWSVPLSDRDTAELKQTELMGVVSQDSKESSITIVKVHTGEKFEFLLSGPYWRYKGPEGLVLIRECFEGGNKRYEFRVDEWSEGDEFILTFERFGGLIVQYLIVRNDEGDSD